MMMRRSRRSTSHTPFLFTARCSPRQQHILPRGHAPSHLAKRSAQARPPAPSDRDLGEPFFWFLRAPDWLMAGALTLCYPILLTERASTALRDAADCARQQGNIDDEITFLMHAVFLERVRRHGLGATLREVWEESR